MDRTLVDDQAGVARTYDRREYLTVLAASLASTLSGCGSRQAVPETDSRQPAGDDTAETITPKTGQDTLTPTTQSKDFTNANFGWSIALADGTALPGVLFNGDEKRGSASIFSRTRTGWEQQATPHAPDGDWSDNFGISVALDTNRALIGANEEDDPNGEESGSVYVFSRTGDQWHQETRLVASDGEPGDRFGTTIALDQGTALISEGLKPTTKGSVYVFSRRDTGWTQETRLTDSNTSKGFGFSLAVEEDTGLIGDFGDENTGAASVYTRTGTGWEQQAKLFAADGEETDRFGSSVALDGDTALIGAKYDENSNGEQAGSAYVFTRAGAGWEQQAKLLAPDGDAEDNFGESVALDSNTALIGVPRSDNTNGPGAGSAYVFTRTETGWEQQAKLLAPDGDTRDRFGRTIALEEGTALVGTIEEGPYGSVYVFSRTADAWSQEGKLTPHDAGMQ